MQVRRSKTDTRQFWELTKKEYKKYGDGCYHANIKQCKRCLKNFKYEKGSGMQYCPTCKAKTTGQHGLLSQQSSDCILE